MDNNTITDKKIFIKFWIIALFTLGMIIWTVYMTVTADVNMDEDDAFLTTYHNVDRDFNKMAYSNNIFNSKYNVKLVVNNKEFYGIDFKDIYLSQRVIAKRADRKNILHVGENSIEIYIQDKKGNSVKPTKLNILVTQALTKKNDIMLDFDKTHKKDFKIDQVGYWNITGVVEVGDDKGYFYIKTNAK